MGMGGEERRGGEEFCSVLLVKEKPSLDHSIVFEV